MLERLARVEQPDDPHGPWTAQLRDERGRVHTVVANDEERANAAAVAFLSGAELEDLLLARAGAGRHRGRRSSMR